MKRWSAKYAWAISGCVAAKLHRCFVYWCNACDEGTVLFGQCQTLVRKTSLSKNGIMPILTIISIVALVMRAWSMHCRFAVAPANAVPNSIRIAS